MNWLNWLCEPVCRRINIFGICGRLISKQFLNSIESHNAFNDLAKSNLRFIVGDTSPSEQRVDALDLAASPLSLICLLNFFSNIHSNKLNYNLTIYEFIISYQDYMKTDKSLNQDICQSIYSNSFKDPFLDSQLLNRKMCYDCYKLQPIFSNFIISQFV